MAVALPVWLSHFLNEFEKRKEGNSKHFSAIQRTISHWHELRAL